jgi:hypothetical protein
MTQRDAFLVSWYIYSSVNILYNYHIQLSYTIIIIIIQLSYTKIPRNILYSIPYYYTIYYYIYFMYRFTKAYIERYKYDLSRNETLAYY